MKILNQGHRYALDFFEPSDMPEQEIQFIQKIHVEPNSTELFTINNGTTNEEVLAMLIDRMNYLQSKFPCRENAIAITHIETALLWLNHRTANRKARGVEGKQLA